MCLFNTIYMLINITYKFKVRFLITKNVQSLSIIKNKCINMYKKVSGEIYLVRDIFKKNIFNC